MKMLNKISITVSLLLLFPLVANCQDDDSKNAKKKVGLPRVEHFKKAKVTRITPSDLPKPYATDSARMPSRRVPQPENAVLRMPEGFDIGVFAEGGLRYPRMMALAPNGDVFVSDSAANRIVVLRDGDGDGSADQRFVFTEATTQPFGMAFFGDWLYIANTDSVVRFRYRPGQTQAAGAPEKIIDLPGRGYRQHWTRNLVFSADGKRLFVSVGSKTNVEVEPDPRRAAISVYDVDGGNHRIYAGGIRNPVGLAINPVTGELWTAVNERDRLGDGLVPDYVTSVKENGFYGFPYSYIGRNIDPRRKDDVKPDLLSKTIVPDVLVESHSAALGLLFYKGKMFPSRYRGDAFVAFHGSWNRASLTGYKIIRIRFGKDGKPVDGSYEDFLTGWHPDPSSREVWGRPVGLLELADGSLLICDDGAKKIWRLTYRN